MSTKEGARLLLVGGGHAHLEVLRRFLLERPPRTELTLVSVAPFHHYSGMASGYLRGTYREEDIRFDLEALTRAAGGTFLMDEALRVDPQARAVHLASGRALSYDVVSFGVGSTPSGSARPEVARHAAVVKPLSRTARIREDLLALAGSSVEGPRRVVVVGGGAGGVEVGCVTAELLRETGCACKVSLIEASDTILPGYSLRFRQRAGLVLSQKGIDVLYGQRVVAVDREAISTDRGAKLPAHLTLWLTGATSYGLFRDSGLAVDGSGFLLVDRSLRSLSNDRILAAGDCATLADYPDTPKAGVFAVRQGPVLWESIVAALAGTQPPRYRPQKSFLSILNTGDGRALLSFGPLVSYSRPAFRLKDRIDRRFMKRYQSLLARS
jgi:selenide,water dikinase